MFRNSSNSPTQRKGLHFENYALGYLKKQGLKLLQRNYHCAFGEIDLIMQDGEHIAFVEVRFRKQNTFGSAFETVDKDKQSRLIKTAKFYLLKAQLYDKVCVRFDIVSITRLEGKPEIQWFRNAFQVH